MGIIAAILHGLIFLLRLLQGLEVRNASRKIKKEIHKRMKRFSNDKIRKAEEARRRLHNHSSDPRSLREDDGYRRD